MKTQQSIEELQASLEASIDELTEEQNPVFNFFSVSPNDQIEEVLSFDSQEVQNLNFITDWEL